jgi:type I restriction enzyme S subunit
MKLFPDSWRICEVNTVCAEIVDCVNKTAPVVESETGYRMIRTTNVRDGRIDVRETRFVEEAVFKKWTRRVLPRRNDIVLTREAPLGEVGLLRSDEKVFLGQRTMLYRADPKKLSQQFLYYSLLGGYVQGQIRGQGSGATVEHLRVPDAEKLAISMPHLDTQKKIAAILTAYDDMIENNQRRIALLEKMAEELYREWFVRMRFPGHEQMKKLKGVPEGWRTLRFAELCEFQKGKTSDESSSNKQDGYLPYINVEFVEGKNTEYVLQKRNSIVCADGDVLMLMDGARSGLVFRAKRGIVGSTFARVAVEPIYRDFVFEFLRVSREHIVSNNTGSAIPHANKEFIHRLVLFMPASDGLIIEFNSRYQNLFKQAINLQRQNELLIRTRDLLLPRLISGKLSVEHLDIKFPPSMEEATHAA